MQLALVCAVALAAAAYLGRQVVRTWAGGGSGCAGGCCKKGAGRVEARPLIRADELFARVRHRREQ
jgi:hypothetical protein